MSSPRIRSPALFAIALSLSAVTAFGDLEGMFDGGIDHPAIEYHKRAAKDQVAELNRRIDEGKVQLQFEPGSGYLRSVLRALNVPVESQLLVFSSDSALHAQQLQASQRRLVDSSSSMARKGYSLGLMSRQTMNPTSHSIVVTLSESAPSTNENRGRFLPALIGLPG